MGMLGEFLEGSRGVPLGSPRAQGIVGWVIGVPGVLGRSPGGSWEIPAVLGGSLGSSLGVHGLDGPDGLYGSSFALNSM